jgi:hypothetical protein
MSGFYSFIIGSHVAGVLGRLTTIMNGATLNLATSSANFLPMK